MELYIIRHGQSTNNVLTDEKLRSFDPPLTDLGIQQAERLAAFLSNNDYREPTHDPLSSFSNYQGSSRFGITHLYCSAMHRALQTAAPVARALGVKPEVWIDIHEQGGMYLEQVDGVVGYPGRTRTEILGEFPDYLLPETVTDTGWYDVKRGYETSYEGAGRAIKVALELRRRAAEEHKESRVAIITHGTFIDLLLKALLGQLPTRRFFFAALNTSITRVDLDGEVMNLRYVNRVDHLPHDMIS